MKTKTRNNGSVLLIAVFAITLISTVVMGILQMNTEELQLVQNQIGASEALAAADAGLNDAFAELRDQASWTIGFAKKAFYGSYYSVTVTGTLPKLTIASTGISSRNFVANVEADITISSETPYIIRIDNLRVNE